MEGNLGKLKGASYGSGLKDAPEELKNDREFMMEAIEHLRDTHGYVENKQWHQPKKYYGYGGKGPPHWICHTPKWKGTAKEYYRKFIRFQTGEEWRTIYTDTPDVPNGFAPARNGEDSCQPARKLPRLETGREHN